MTVGPAFPFVSSVVETPLERERLMGLSTALEAIGLGEKPQ
jgi:hypothetical protein